MDVSADGSSGNIKLFEQYIQQNFSRDLSLEEVADYLSLHPNYLCHLLKQKTGMTFVRYLRLIRIERAKAILTHNPIIPLDQVSRKVGYENPRHFYKVFKQCVGQTPGSYREEAVNRNKVKSF
ncbi:Arabinose operon regulatory protein [compost metagenome]